MSAVAYTVTAILPEETIAERYIAWLEDGHVDAVIAGGAHSATIVRLDREPSDPPGVERVEVRYIFPTRAVFEKYVEVYAPALRSEGIKLFGPDSGVRFERRTGTIV
ncbi:MAG TPA: DUF4286 family protein [Phycisphaerales bacterium]|nr:DUF4286 family protein [Phycisphaerales bacterium]